MLETFVAVCESCGKKLTVPVKAQGRVLPCPRCGVTFEVPNADAPDGFAADTAAEDAQPTIPDLPVAKLAPESPRPKVPILAEAVPAKPMIAEPVRPQPARSRPRVSERDVFGPVPAAKQDPTRPDDADDDDVPKRKRRNRDTEKKTRWGTDAKPDPYSTTNPNLLHNDGWIDPQIIRFFGWMVFYSFVTIIVGGIIRKLLMGIYE